MATFIDSIKAVITRLVFSAHSLLAIWQVTIFKKNVFYWYLCSPILLLFFEGIFTLTIKENQEWKWFCPSVFLYLASIVPSIWLLELDKVDRRIRSLEETLNLTSNAAVNFKELSTLIGGQIKFPEINLTTETWITLIEQFLMLILIIGRWMLPKGDLTRDQLSQILLVYIGTAADIIEFFDSFKDDKVAAEQILFTVVLTATKSRKSRMSTTVTNKEKPNKCCNIDIWGIALNIVLQDAPFLAFRLLIIIHYNIISYMNVFFTCKNTLVIILQLYRLHVVYSENKQQAKTKDFELTSISIISKPNMYSSPMFKQKKHETHHAKYQKEKKKTREDRTQNSRRAKNSRKDTGYSTESSHASNKNQVQTTSKTKLEDRRQKSNYTAKKLKNNAKIETNSDGSESDSSSVVIKHNRRQFTKKAAIRSPSTSRSSHQTSD
ncbi:hypothetical protein RN001_007661 [Aquatica leii]|uniref:Transmembrane protein 26 n=1 Tax=Aquatica leii TaxID=1421715 RepID=A0AAN7Q4H5_9COLE|nr:hypothetical protein RN001_007661 [Aquatica leii]